MSSTIDEDERLIAEITKRLYHNRTLDECSFADTPTPILSQTVRLMNKMNFTRVEFPLCASAKDIINAVKKTYEFSNAYSFLPDELQQVSYLLALPSLPDDVFKRCNEVLRSIGQSNSKTSNFHRAWRYREPNYQFRKALLDMNVFSDVSYELLKMLECNNFIAIEPHYAPVFICCLPSLMKMKNTRDANQATTRIKSIILAIRNSCNHSDITACEGMYKSTLFEILKNAVSLLQIPAGIQLLCLGTTHLDDEISFVVKLLKPEMHHAVSTLFAVYDVNLNCTNTGSYCLDIYNRCLKTASKEFIDYLYRIPCRWDEQARLLIVSLANVIGEEPIMKMFQTDETSELTGLDVVSELFGEESYGNFLMMGYPDLVKQFIIRLLPAQLAQYIKPTDDSSLNYLVNAVFYASVPQFREKLDYATTIITDMIYRDYCTILNSIPKMSYEPTSLSNMFLTLLKSILLGRQEYLNTQALVG